MTQAGYSLIQRSANHSHRHPGEGRDLMMNVGMFGERAFCIDHSSREKVPGSAICGPGMTLPLFNVVCD